MKTTSLLDMNTFIPSEADDSVFYYARQVTINDNGWHIDVDPAACLVALRDNDAGLPTVAELRSGLLSETRDGEKTIYTGRILLSAGIILTVNGKVLMLQRDDKAPVDPLKWTSAAGRCDREPLLTALKEFYEEVVLYECHSGRPVFVNFSGHPYGAELKEIYAETLVRTNFNCLPKSWSQRSAILPLHTHPLLRDVKVCFGNESSGSPNEAFTGRFLPIFDRGANILELRLLAELTVAPEVETDLGFLDGEYLRPVRLFDQKEFAEMDDSSLVYAMACFKAHGLL